MDLQIKTLVNNLYSNSLFLISKPAFKYQIISILIAIFASFILNKLISL